MKRFKFLTILCLTFGFGYSNAQTSLHIANEYYKQHRYTKAAQFYSKAIKRKPTSFATERLGDCYRNMKDYNRAEFWYEKSLAYNESSAKALLNYGQMLKTNEKFEKAKTIFSRYGILPGVDVEMAKKLTASCDSAMKWNDEKSQFLLVNRKDLNSGYSEFGVSSLSNVAFVISTNRPNLGNKRERLSRDIELPYFQIAIANLDSNKMASGVYPFPLDQANYHQATPCFSENLDTIYFTETRITKSTKEVINRLGIYYSIRLNNKWSKPIPFAFNNENYSVGHPFLTNNGTELYFVSDVPGGQGGFDIYVSTKQNGQWSTPINLGPEVNSSEDEFYPVVKNNQLYFSSMGHIGMGGLDIFMADFDGLNWTRVQNMKTPFNSAQDDFGLYFNDELQTGFISSNRRGGLGFDDIYAFNYNQRLPDAYFVELRPFWRENGQSIWATEANTKLTAVGRDTEILPYLINGKTYYPVEQDVNYLVQSEQGNRRAKKEFIALGGLQFADSSTVSTLPLQMGVFYTFDVELLSKLKGVYALNNIYYDFNKATLRPEAKVELDNLVKILQDNPEVSIQIGSYCDARGNDLYNLALSQRRAQSVVSYLIDKGITQDRLKARGFGETKPVNGCINGVDCTEEEHQENRRTEFEVEEEN